MPDATVPDTRAPSTRAPSTRAVPRNAMLASVGVLFSRVSGLLRETLFAALFGASREYDAFLMAFRIPNLLRDLFAEGALSQAFVKVFTQVDKRDGSAAAFAVANRVLTLLLVVLTGVCALGMVFTPGVVGVMAPGFADIPGKTALTVTLARVMFPFILLVAVAAQLMGMLNARGEYRLPQAASTFFNLGSVVVGVGGAWLLAPGFMSAGARALWQGGTAGAASDPVEAGAAMVGMAVGVVVGGCLQMLVQVPALWRMGWRPAPVWDVKDARVREVLLLMGPAVVGAAAVQVNVALINSNYASHLGDRPLSWLSYAFRFMQFPIGMFGVAVASAAAPEFARATADRSAPDLPGLRRAIRESVALACLLCVPAAVGLWVLAEPLIGLIYEHGRFTASDTSATAAALGAYAVGLTGYAAIKVLQPALLALDDARTPMLVALASIGVNLGSNHMAVRVLDLGHVGLAVSTSVVAMLNAAVLAAVLRRRAGGLEGGALLWSLVRTSASAAVMGVAVAASLAGSRALWPGRGTGQHALQLATGVGVGVLVFGVMVVLMRVPEAAFMVDRVKRRFRRKAAA